MRHGNEIRIFSRPNLLRVFRFEMEKSRIKT